MINSGRFSGNEAIKKIIKSFFEYITKPFGQEFPFFLALCLLASSADLIFWAKEGNVLFAGYMAVHGIIMCYFITLIVGLFKNTTLKILHIFFLVLGFINLLLDAGVHSICGFGFTEDMIALIMGTNPQEGTEFIKAYMNIHMLACIIGVSFLVLIVYYYSNSLSKLFNKTLKVICLLLTVACVFYVNYRHSENWSCVFLNKINAFIKYKPAVSLKEYQKTYDIERVGDTPDNIVLIIGESLSKSHMSAYGYAMETTPMLEHNKNAILFDNVEAAWTSTVQAFLKFMTLHTGELPKEYYLEPNIIDIMKSAGYSVSWISNQSAAGVHDNYVSKYAELADTTIWCGQQNLGLGKKDCDEILIPVINNLYGSEIHQKFSIIHLMGSHPEFNLRYPEEFSHFNEEQYSNIQKKQRKPISEYDNSVRYNDYVVEQIVDIFTDTETAIIYFSDHAMDLFNSADDYIGHARLGDPKSLKAGMDIPFTIYLTPKFKEKHFGTYQKIISARHNTFNTEQLGYTLLDLTGIRIKGMDDNVDSLSLFSAKKVYEN